MIVSSLQDHDYTSLYFYTALSGRWGGGRSYTQRYALGYNILPFQGILAHWIIFNSIHNSGDPSKKAESLSDDSIMATPDANNTPQGFTPLKGIIFFHPAFNHKNPIISSKYCRSLLNLGTLFCPPILPLLSSHFKNVPGWAKCI